MSNKKTQIDHILKQLVAFKSDPCFKHSDYAIEQNIIFFKACRSIFTYVRWLIFNAPKLKAEMLMELTDFGVSEWDREMHNKLIEMEGKEFPGLIKPLVRQLSRFIISKNKPLILVNFGSGGMETERQVLQDLIKTQHQHRVVFIGVDISSTAQEIATSNLSRLGQNVVVKNINHLDKKILEDEIDKIEKNKHLVLLCKNNIFELEKYFPREYFDMAFHSLFVHHLDTNNWQKVADVSMAISKSAIGYDGYKSWLFMIPQTIVGWKHPIFLNAEIFSSLRFLPKKELKRSKLLQSDWTLTFFSNKHFMLKYHA